MRDFHSSPSGTHANVIAFAFLLMAFLTGIGSAFQLPVLSLFLSQEVQASPMAVGFFYSFNAVVGIIIGQLLGNYSDRLPDRRKLILICCFMAAAGYFIFAFSRNYYILITFAVVLFGLGSASNPQIFAFAREYADSSRKEAVMFSTIMRTQISLAWIVGPPLAFSLVVGMGFEVLFSIGALTFIGSGLLALLLLPKLPRQTSDHSTTTKTQAPQQNRRSTLYLFLATMLIFCCNSIYLINMPLYVIKELQLEEKLAGILMGTAAGLEIPIMLLAGYLTRYISKKSLLLFAIGCGLLFYAGLLWIENHWGLIALQLLNAVLIGITATIGMLYFQDLMPQQMGAATTLFTNAAKSSWVIAGPIAGAIASIWNYQSVFYFCLLFIVLAFCCMWRVKTC
ncbi:MFS transporter [Testudinibacter aquarius]|uniref:MFS transporter n=1 Tax=Testudinibacter aquarius TaxID=1524974 RepID=A0A4R3Y473_9PAST|nr:MFS transporter [Testudinibacter aquarius]KAE9527937.1 sugar transporter [Testudinibacter aquarius]TCV86540.1 SET family sugar efflux transporter-like MFS transporter [Testudinibacter aquarius]TNG93574.1 MFS transporter [Testudinibacter aquarius]